MVAPWRGTHNSWMHVETQRVPGGGVPVGRVVVLDRLRLPPDFLSMPSFWVNEHRRCQRPLCKQRMMSRVTTGSS